MTEDKKKLLDRHEAEELEEQEFEISGSRPIVYIRSVTKSEVEGSLPPDAPEGPYFALHDEDGRPLALFSDAASAWAAARANNMETVSVH